MSVVQMSMLTVAGPLEQFDAVVRTCVIGRAFHPENAIHFMGQIKGLRPFDAANPYTNLLRRAEQVADEVGIPLEFSPFEGKPMDIDAFSCYFDELEKKVNDLAARRDKLLQSARDEREVVSQLQNLKGVAADLGELWSMDFVRFRYGYLPRETYDSFQESLNDQEDLLFFPTNLGPKLVYGVYFTTKAARKRVDSLFASLHFTRINISEEADGSADEAMAALAARADRAESDAQAVVEELAALRTREHDGLLSAYSFLRYQNDSHELRRYAAHSRETFYLMGWVPKSEAEAFAANLTGTFSQVSCVVDDAKDIAESSPSVVPPTKLKNSFLGRVFQPFLEMYGLPAYNELDPSIFMAITYCLFFGIMFGDLGQGLGLALIGFVLAKWKKMWLGNIITCCGLSAAVFGCIYGSVFGIEDILPGFKILAEEGEYLIPGASNVMTLLIFSIAMGVFMLAFVMVLNIINGVRQHNFEKIFFGPNGLAGMVFYLGLIIAAVCTLLLGVNLFVPAYVLPVLVLPLVLILLKEPLSLLAARDPAWREVKLGSLLVTGFFELFETCLSFLTNTLSFLRVGAYAITHVGLMLVVQTLAGMAGGLDPLSPGGVIVMVLGNAFVMGFEGLLVGIQALRLEFYELFGRFYDDGGIPFSPKVINYAEHTGS